MHITMKRIALLAALVLGGAWEVTAQEASESSRSASAFLVRCTRGGRIDAECMRSTNRTLMTEAGEAMRTALENFGPEFRDTADMISRSRSIPGGLGGDANRAVLLGLARGTRNAIDGSRSSWDRSDRAAVEQVIEWQGMTCNPAGSGSSISEGCSAVALAATLTDLCADDGLNGACIRSVLPMLRDQMGAASSAFTRVNLRVETVSALANACGSSEAQRNEGTRVAGACILERSLTVAGDIAYNRLPRGGARRVARRGGRSGSRDGERGATGSADSEGSSGSGGTGGTGTGLGSTGEGRGGGGASSTESGDGRPVAEGSRRTGGGVEGGTGAVAREGVAGVTGGRPGGESGRREGVEMATAPTPGSRRGVRGSGGARESTSGGVDHGPASDWIRNLLGIEGSDTLAEMLDLAAREERAEMMSCPRYVSTDGVPACTRASAEIADGVAAAATDPTMTAILSAASSGEAPGTPTSVEPYNETRFYESVVQRELDGLLDDYEALLNRPGAGDSVATFLRGIENSCGNSRLGRHFKDRVNAMLAAREPSVPGAERNAETMLRARVADLNSIDSDIHALQAEFFDPTQSTEYNSRAINDYLNSTMGMLMPCGSILRGANSVIGAFRQAANAPPSSCRIRNVAGMQFVMPFETASADAEITRNLERIMTGDRSWRPSDGAISTRTCNLAASTVEECRRSCVGGSASDQILYCQRTSWPSDVLQRTLAAESGMTAAEGESDLPPVVPAARAELSARERCQSKFDLMQALIARRAMLMADYPELAHERDGVPAYRRLARGEVTLDRLRRESTDHFNDLSRDRSSWFSAANANQVGVRVAIRDMCANPREAAEGIMADPDHMSQVLSCGRPDSLPVRPPYDPVAADPSADSACRYLRTYAPEMCGNMNRLAYNRMSRTSYLETLMHGPMTAMDVMGCANMVGGLARVGAASVRLAATVARVGATDGMIMAGRTALAGVRSGVVAGARLTFNQAVESVTTAHSLAMLTGLGGYGWVAGSMGAETLRRQLNEQILACSRGETDACGRVSDMRDEYEVMARSAGGEGLGMIVAGILIPGGVGDEIPTATRTLSEARTRLSGALGRVADLADVARGRALTTAEARQLREGRAAVEEGMRAANEASRRVSRLVGEARRRNQADILARLRAGGMPEAEVRARSELLLTPEGEPVRVPGPDGTSRTVRLNELPSEVAEAIASGRGSRTAPDAEGTTVAGAARPRTEAGGTSGSTPTTRAPDEVLAVDGSLRGRMTSVRGRLRGLFGRIGRGAGLTESGVTDVLPRVNEAISEVVRMVEAGTLPVAEGARLISEARAVQEEFLPILERTLTTRFGFASEEVGVMAANTRRSLAEMGENLRTREGLAEAARRLNEDPSVVLTRAMERRATDGERPICVAIGAPCRNQQPGCAR